MQFKIKITHGAEVKWVGVRQDEPVYYGGPPPETGLWKLDVLKIADYLDAGLRDLSYGESIDVFVLGFEIAELEGWGNLFTKMSRYTSHRPGMRLLLSVGQLNWPDVKDLSVQEQFQRFSEALMDAVSRLAGMKRKPRGFNPAAFAADVARLLAQCPAYEMEA